MSKINIDSWLLFSSLFLVMFGLLMVTSASMNIAKLQFGSSLYFAIRHGVMLSLSILVLYLTLFIPIYKWQKYSFLLLAVAVVLLLAVCIPGIGRQINGSRRWLAFAGFTFQASELAKCAMILFVSDFLSRKEQLLRKSMRPLLNMFLLLAMIAVLLLLEPDFGALTVIVSIVMSLMFLAGIPIRYFIYLALGAIASLGVIAISAPYRLLRLTSFLDPWQHPFSSGYQLTQSLIAFGRGGVSGVGLGDSVQKLSYLPEAHTDFVFAVIGEELGFFGCGFVIVLLTILLVRGFQIASDAMHRQNRFAGYIAYGVSIWVAVQASINIGVNIGLLPTKGLTLPLVSYGGSSMVIMGLAIGWVFRIYHENQVWKQKTYKYDKSRLDK